MTTPMGQDIVSNEQRATNVTRLRHLKTVVMGLSIFALVTIPIIFGVGAISLSRTLATVTKHQSATSLCQGLNSTNEHIQIFVLGIAQQQVPPPTAAQILALQSQLDANFPQADCTKFPLEPPTVPTTVAPAVPAPQ